MSTADLIAAVRKRREVWVDLGEGRRVRGLLPGVKARFALSAATTAEARTEVLLRCADAWEGVTVGDIAPHLPEPQAAAPFSMDVWLAIADERTDWGTVFVLRMAEALGQETAESTAATGN